MRQVKGVVKKMLWKGQAAGVGENPCVGKRDIPKPENHHNLPCQIVDTDGFTTSWSVGEVGSEPALLSARGL